MAILLNGLFSMVMEGYLLSSGSPNVNVWTTTLCADRCLADVSCVAFFHSKTSRLCQLQTTRNITGAGLTQDSGTRFYILSEDSCPIQKGYRLFRDPPLCFRIGHDKITQHDALTACQNDGGYLLRIDSQKKQNFIALFHEESDPPWVDGSDKDVEDEWRFSDGTMMTYTDWASSPSQQPNNDGDCIQIGDTTSLWYDASCTQHRMYICEIPVK